MIDEKIPPPPPSILQYFRAVTVETSAIEDGLLLLAIDSEIRMLRAFTASYHSRKATNRLKIEVIMQQPTL